MTSTQRKDPRPRTDAAGSPAEVVREVYAAFERGDAEAVMSLFAEDVEIRQSDELPWGGTWRGRDEAMQFFGTLTAHIRTRVEIDRLIVAGDTVVEVGRTVGEAIGAGNRFAIDEVHVWRVCEGRIASMHAYVDNAAMREAIGTT